jgi:hypothetical protein
MPLVSYIPWCSYFSRLQSITHAPCLYYGTFNAEFVIFLLMVDDFSIGCKLEETYTNLCDILDKNTFIAIWHDEALQRH